MIVEPNEKQHPAIQKMRLDVDKLREATDEALSSFFAGKENEKNAKKKPYLDEIFKVAMQEQRYKHGEIGQFPPLSKRHSFSPSRLTPFLFFFSF